MKYIKFYNGEENGIIIENSTYNDSIFKDQYKQALDLFQEIMDNPLTNISNIIAFCGDRGEGKTSCMTTVRHILDYDNYDTVKEVLTGHQIFPQELELLPVIDPAFFDQKHNVLELVLGQLYGQFERYTTEKTHSEQDPYKKNEVVKHFHKTKLCMRHLEKEKRELYDPLEELDALSAGISLKNYIQELFKQYLDFIKKKKLVICIDDLDLNMSGAYEMAEQVRKYLNNKHCILLISLKVDQLIDAISINIGNELKTSSNTIDINGMASKYVTKLIPFGNRINMPKVSDFCNNPLYIYDERKDQETQSDNPNYNSVKEAVVQLIFSKTRYLFYNSKGSISPIVPNNLRSLRQLLGMLYRLPDFESNDLHMRNKQQFKSYFYQSWIQKLNKENQQFVSKLIDNENSNSINKMVVSYLRNLPDLRQENLPDSFKPILNTANYAYNVSIGDVFVILNYLEQNNVDEQLKFLVFFLKSFYSIRMYEYYDVISEQQGELHPEEDDKNSIGEIYKSDAWFKRTNVLQRFVNGSYFTYEPGDILAKIQGKQPRDFKVIKGKLLMDILKKKISEIETDASITEDSIDEFKQKFKLLEFFMLTITRSIEQKEFEAGTYADIKRTDSIPYYLKPFNKEKNYFVFDVLSPFYNMLNIKYTYDRFDKSLYNFALNHEWSLLRQMIAEATKNDEPKVEIVDYWEKRLISDSTIRNAEVLSSMMEQMKSIRYNVRTPSVNKDRISEFYQSIISSEMKTYDRIENDAYTIKFDFLTAISNFLKECPEDLFDSIFVLDDKEIGNDSMMNSFKDFLESVTSAIKGSTIITKIREKQPEIYGIMPRAEWKMLFPVDETKNKSDIIKILKENPIIQQYLKDLEKKHRDGSPVTETVATEIMVNEDSISSTPETSITSETDIQNS